MKIYLTTIITTFSILLSAQQSSNVINSSGLPTTVDFNKVNSITGGKVLNYSDIQGTPYMYKDYKKIKIGEFADIIPARYNAYTDEIEIKLNEKVQSLPKEKAYSHIKFLDSNEMLMYVVDNTQKGYFYVLSDGDIKLLRKNAIRFIDEQPAQSSYATPQPAKFIELKPTYFFYKDSQLLPIKKENDLVTFFPQRDIKKILKDRKLKLENEKDLVILTNLLN
ncbi:hypothetical protein [Epilithonimonas arachidiradicis]|uniref:Uncharacterized protein n=1 Tax=Epilithonimonas arachidiradicis TaxID=1617282 RepID=A0A420DBI8_9FLAO|nr:hypothetical protein [Epilithonimonas arachidiradicis]RKE88849.1 hypothetical protein BXY58_0976 [Epilithonimonas arachidiradicis]GGG54588.1 hypothetical protein GCM10007332_15290 [Epilithonimonas arachidiradicis]